MTLKQILNIFKKENNSSRQELAEAANLSRTGLCNMLKRNDMKLSAFLKIVRSQGFEVYMTDGISKYNISDLED